MTVTYVRYVINPKSNYTVWSSFYHLFCNESGYLHYLKKPHWTNSFWSARESVSYWGFSPGWNDIRIIGTRLLLGGFPRIPRNSHHFRLWVGTCDRKGAIIRLFVRAGLYFHLYWESQEELCVNYLKVITWRAGVTSYQNSCHLEKNKVYACWCYVAVSVVFLWTFCFFS